MPLRKMTPPHRPCPEIVAPNQADLDNIKSKDKEESLLEKSSKDLNNRHKSANDQDVQNSSVSVIYPTAMQVSSVLHKQDHRVLPDIPDSLDAKIKPERQKSDASLKQQTKPIKDALEDEKKKEALKNVCSECGHILGPPPEICDGCGQVKLPKDEICKDCGQRIPEKCPECGEVLSKEWSIGDLAALSQYRFELAQAKYGFYDDDWSVDSSSCRASTSRKMMYNGGDYDSIYSGGSQCCCGAHHHNSKEKPCKIADSATLLRKNKWSKFCSFLKFGGQSKKGRDQENLDKPFAKQEEAVAKEQPTVPDTPQAQPAQAK